MARKNKRQGNAGVQGGYVPASLDSAHSSRSNSHAHGDSGPVGPNHGSPSVAQYSRSTANYANRRSSEGVSRGKIILIVVLVALIGAVGGLGFFIYKEVQKQSINQDLHNMSRETMQAIDNELTGMTTFEEPFTVLLLGTDERVWDMDEGIRTDTIVLCRVDPTQNIISMVSIPRDTMIQLNGVGTTKINSAYSYGGPAGTIAAVKDLTGVNIDHYAQINFDGLMSLVDAIGGIDVYVEEEIDDPDAGDIVIPAGQQHLDGAQTLVFSRSRAYADGDFTRVSNQRKVIEAIVHKGLEAPASELYGIIQASTEFLTTDTAMDVDFIYSLADQIRHNNDYPVRLYSATIPASTDMLDGVSYVVADKSGVEEMMSTFMAGGDVGSNGEEPANEPGATNNAGGDSVIGAGANTSNSSGTNANNASGANTNTNTSNASGANANNGSNAITNNGTGNGGNAA